MEYKRANHQLLSEDLQVKDRGPWRILQMGIAKSTYKARKNRNPQKNSKDSGLVPEVGIEPTRL